MSPVIEVKSLSYAYGTHTVLSDVTFTVTAGDYVGVIGPNGGGKTTLVKLLLGILKPQHGEVRVAGKAAGTKESLLQVGYVPQRVAEDTTAFPATVFEIVESGLVAGSQLFGRFGAGEKEAVTQALHTANIYDLKDRLITTLSGGQRQRVFIARALVNHPTVLILDEPFTGVDIATQRSFYDFLEYLNREQGITIILVTHDMDVVTTEAHSVLCLNQSMLCFDHASTINADHLLQQMYGKPVTHVHNHTHI